MISPRAAYWFFATALCLFLDPRQAVSETAISGAASVAPTQPQAIQLLTGATTPEPETGSYTRLLDYSDTCPVDLPDWASESERYAWNLICRGNVADMSLFRPTSQNTADQPTNVEATTASGPATDGAGCIAVPKSNVSEEAWPDHRRLSARFIKLIATREPYVDIPAIPSINIRCAKIEGQINLYNERVPQRLVLQDSRIPNGVMVQGARFDFDLVLDGSDLLGNSFQGAGLEAENFSFRNGRAGVVELSWATVKGSVVLSGSLIGMLPDPKTPDQRGGLFANGLKVGRNLTLAERADIQIVDLVGAEVGGSVVANSVNVRAKMNLNGSDIGGALLMRDGARMGELDLVSSRMARGLELSGLQVVKPSVGTTGSVPTGYAGPPGLWAVTGSISAGRLSVGDSAFLNYMTVEGKLILQEASINGPLYLGGSRVTEQFEASGIHVSGPVSLGLDAALAAVSFRGATIEGALQLFNSRYDGPFDLRNAQLGALELWENGMDVIWGLNASLDLRNADIGVLQARFPQNWELQGSTDAQGRPLRLPVQLENLRYDRLGSATPPQSSLPPELDTDSLIQWVSDSLPKSDQGQAAGFIPQPFRQLEETLRSMGAEAEADQVQVAGHMHQIQAYSADLTGWIKTFAGIVWWALVGFGAHPFRVLWWFAALVGLGVIVSRWSPSLSQRGWTDSFWYSLENAFPLLQPSSEHQKVIHDHPFLQNFFHFQKVAGFVLATILVGALTLLGG